MSTQNSQPRLRTFEVDIIHPSNCCAYAFPPEIYSHEVSALNPQDARRIVEEEIREYPYRFKVCPAYPLCRKPWSEIIGVRDIETDTVPTSLNLLQTIQRATAALISAALDDWEY